MIIDKLLSGLGLAISINFAWAIDLYAATDDSSQYEAEIQRITSRYPHMAPDSNLNKKNIGKIVWATRQINYNEQDSIKTINKFKLSDPIFGRLYIERSLGNTPVYSSSSNKPHPSTRFEYEWKLFIDEKEKQVKFGAFANSNLNDKAGETWTTWQFAPNPVPFDESFKQEAEAWRTATKGLTKGNHNIRFELWATAGNYRSREPISVGEFTLQVNKNDSISVADSFPKDKYNGNDLEKVRAAIVNAVSGSTARKPEKIIKAAVTSNWMQGMYKKTRQRYRTISGALLWPDKDGDSVCRYTTYNFVSDHLGGGNWSPLRFKSFCLNCAEGDTRCQ